MYVRTLWLVLGRTHGQGTAWQRGGREEAGWGATGTRHLSCKVSRAWRGGRSTRLTLGAPALSPARGIHVGRWRPVFCGLQVRGKVLGVVTVTQDRGHDDMAQAMLLRPTSAGDSGPSRVPVSCKAPGEHVAVEFPDVGNSKFTS